MKKGYKMRNRLFFILLFSVVLLLPSAFAINEPFSINGTVYNSSFALAANANVTITADVITAGGGGPPQTSAQSWSGITNGSGYFVIGNINGTGDDFPTTAMLLFHVTVKINGSDGNATEVSPVMPPLPKQALSQLLSGGNFYLVPAGTIKITAVNSSGVNQTFSGMVFDKKLGMPMMSFSNVNSTDVVVPRDRNYSIMIYQMPTGPGTGAPPQSTDLTNLTNYTTGAGTRVFSHVQNLTTVPVSVSGNLNISGNVTNVTFTRLEGHIYITSFIPTGAQLPAGGQAGTPGYYTLNSTTGIYNFTLLGTAGGMKVLLSAYANNGTHYFGSFQNITLLASDAANGRVINFTLRLLAGAAESAANANKSVTTLNFTDASTGAAINGGGHSEVSVTYNDNLNGAIPVKWIVEPSASGTLSVPLLAAYDGNITAKMYSHNFAPKETKLNLTNSTINIPLKRFGTEKPPGSVGGAGNLSGVAIFFYRNNDTCNVQNPPASCNLVSAGAAEQFNPFQAAMAGSVNMRMVQSTGIALYFLGVDLLASGPPDSSYDDTAQNTSSGATTFQQIWKFGSMAPQIYNSVYIGLPYNGSGSRINDKLPINIQLPLLYDSNWNLVYNSSSSNLNSLPSEYADFNSSSYGWFNHTGAGVPCTENVNSTCYIDRENKMLWLHIPHFSGVGPQVSSYPTGINLTSDKTVYSCYPNCVAYINVTHNDTATFGGLHNFTINVTSALNIANFSIGYYNISNASWAYLAANNGTLINFNFTPGTIQFNFTITMFNISSTKWSFNFTIDNGSAYSLDPYLDVINLTGPLNAGYVGNNSINFTFKLFSDNVTTQNCTISPSSGTSASVIAANGSIAGLLFNLSQTASGVWNVSCNESGISQSFTYVSNQPPQITINTPGNNTNTSSRLINITFLDAVVGLINSSLINVTINESTYSYPDSFNCSPSTSIFTANYTSAVTCWFTAPGEGMLELNVTAKDGIGWQQNLSINFTIDTLVPSPPALFATNISDYDLDGNMEINWSAVSGAKRYILYRSTSNFSPSGSTFLYNVTGTNNNFFEDNTTEHNTNYWYSIVSVDFAENYNISNPSSRFNATTNDTTMPRLITAVDATNVSDGSITLNWTSISRDMSNNAEGGTIYYRIFKIAGNNASDANTTMSSSSYVGNTTSTSYTVVTLAAGTNYTFVVATFDRGGNYNDTITGSNNVSKQSSTCSNSYSSCGSYGACQSTSTMTRTCTRTCYSGSANSTTESTACTYSGTTTTTGGGGGETAAAKESFAGFNIAADSTTTKTLTSTSIGFTSIAITAKNAVTNVDLSIEKLASKPSTAETPAGKIYQYIQLTTTIKEADASLIKIKFRVEKSWLTSSGVNEDDVILMRLADKWSELKTTKTGSDGTYVSYEADSPGFSNYAIGQKAAAAKAAPAANETTTTTTTTTTETENETQPPVVPPIPAKNETKKTELITKEGVSWQMFILAIVVLIAIGFALLFAFRKRKKGLF